MVWTLLSKCTKHEEECSNFFVLIRKSELYLGVKEKDYFPLFSHARRNGKMINNNYGKLQESKRKLQSERKISLRMENICTLLSDLQELGKIAGK